jgi:hypothetical protein
MATIGNSPKYANYAPEYFTGNGVQIAFATLYNIASAASILVIIDGIKQLANTYSVNGNTVTFSEAPPNLSSIEIINLATVGQVNTVADNTVSTSKLVDANVTLAKMAPDSVGTSNLVDSSVSTRKLNFDTGSFSFRNKIIGGDFSTNPWQRGTSFVAPTTTSYTADRWRTTFVTSAVVTVLKSTDAPTASQAGVFTQHCLHVDITTADDSLASTDRFEIVQAIEGFNAKSFGFGQSGTRYATLSFWHKHTKTGIHCVSLTNADGTRSYVSEYTQNVSNAWEDTSITIPVDTLGTWLYDNGIGLFLRFSLAAGSSYVGSANTWISNNYTATANQVNNLDSTANNFKIALVQLEIGDVATPFESLSYGQVLSLCQRYYEKSYDISVAPGTATYSGAEAFRRTSAEGIAVFNGFFKVQKRATPTVTWYSPSNGTSGQIYNVSTSASITVTGTYANNPPSEYKAGSVSHAATGGLGDITSGQWTANAEL